LCFVASAQEKPASASAQNVQHFSPCRLNSSPLIQKVCRATERFVSIEQAHAEGYGAVATACVSGNEFGAMGVHLLTARPDGALSGEERGAAISEPLGHNQFRLVGVEYIVDSAKWFADKSHLGPPTVDGHQMNFVGAPNRYGLDAFFELHVWAFEGNPVGSF